MAIAGSPFLGLRYCPVSSSAKCIASHTEPPLPQEITYYRAQNVLINSCAAL